MSRRQHNGHEAICRKQHCISEAVIVQGGVHKGKVVVAGDKEE